MTDDEAPGVRRWGPEGPPEEAYSRVTDPERYLGLHAVADGLIDDLLARFEVAAGPSDEVGLWRGDVVRATGLRPAGGGAPITVILTGFAVAVRAGHCFRRPFPTCGCDACDETPADAALHLAEVVGIIVAGGLTETRRRRVFGKDTFSIELRSAEGWEQTSGTIDPRDPDEEHDAIPVGATHWAPWPERAVG